MLTKRDLYYLRLLEAFSQMEIRREPTSCTMDVRLFQLQVTARDKFKLNSIRRSYNKFCWTNLSF
jgi:hypothetical protein